MSTIKVQDGQGDPPPPSQHPGWPPPGMVAMMYISTGSSAISAFACFHRHHMVAVAFAALATLTGLIGIVLVSRRR